jgi:putative transposase
LPERGTALVRRYHQQYHTSGHVWQGRFRSFPIEEDDHLLTVDRYVERNPLRAGLVKRAQDWLWSSAALVRANHPVLDPGPVARPAEWLTYVNQPQSEAEVARLRDSVRRRRPYGTAEWTAKTAGRMDLQASLRPLGRPRKDASPQATLFGLEHPGK